ncbi:MAG: hypothetical protein Kow0089_07810 [Desulfobulbaceae bacterium]
MKKKVLCSALALGMGFGLASAAMAGTVTVDEDVLKAMQQQLAQQAKAIAELQKKLSTVPEAGKEEHVAVVTHPGKTKVQVSLYGQVNKGVLYADDGNRNKTFFTDNDASSTRFGIKANVKPGGAWTAGSLMEFEYQTNPSNKVSMDDESVNEDLHMRKLSVFVDEKDLGRLTVGQYSAATDGIAEIDLSGTALAGYDDGAVIGGGLSFYDDLTNSYSGTTVGSVFKDLDGGRYDLVRYDSPKFGGFSLAASVGEEDKNEVALRYAAKFDMLKVAAGIGYATEGRDSVHDDRWSGSISALLNNGLNITLAGGVRSEEDDNRDDPSYFYGKIGYQVHAFDIGKTAFSVDYGSYQDFVLNNDDATLLGAQLVQYIDDLSTQFYLGYRLLQLDRDQADLQDVNAVVSGLRIKF